MNIQSEIDYFSDLALIDKARFVMRIICELAEEAKTGASDASEAPNLKFIAEMCQRLARFSYQMLSEDTSRPPDDVVIRMLLGTRADKNTERIVQSAYRRVLTTFESFDTTVLLNSH
jgi:hypothetical protein